MSSGMLDARGRTFVLSVYVISAGFALVVFGIVIGARYPAMANVNTISELVGSFALIASVGLGANGGKGIVESFQRGKQPSSEVVTSVKTSGAQPPTVVDDMANVPPAMRPLAPVLTVRDATHGVEQSGRVPQVHGD